MKNRKFKPMPDIHKIGAIVLRDRKVLVVKKGDIYIAPGGRIEAGETHEQCLARELLEEVGLKLVSCTHFGTFIHVSSHEPGSLIRMEVYKAETSGDPIPANEIKEARFVGFLESKQLKMGSIMQEEVIPKLHEAGVID